MPENTQPNQQNQQANFQGGQPLASSVTPQPVQNQPTQNQPVKPSSYTQPLPAQSQQSAQTSVQPAQQPVRPAQNQQQVPPIQAQAPQQVQGQNRIIQPLRPGQKIGNRPPPNPKRLLFGCLGCGGVLILFFIIFVLIFVSQTSSTGENPLARPLGLDTGSFIQNLILIVNLVFGTVAVILFFISIIGLFKLVMARRDDKEAKKKALTLAGVSGLLLFFTAFIWIGVYLFLNSKKVPVVRVSSSGFVTEPAQTLGLTAPITIKFDATNVPISKTRYDILSYLWNFGDGQTSTTITTSHTYKDKGTNNGRFDVSLLVTKRDKQTKAESVDTFTTTVTIANVELNASFKADPQNGPAPLTVNFDASESSAPGSQISSYDWDFNNDNIFNDANGVQVSNKFEQIGTYKVNLRITDGNNQFKISSQEIEVTDENVPKAVIDIPTKDGKYFSNIQYAFQAENSTSPNGKITKYEWDFGDGSAKANTRTANHIYKTQGLYEVILTVTDETNLTGTASENIKVEQQASAPLAVINTVPNSAKEGESVNGTVPFQISFDASKSQDSDNNIVDYKWDFDGDGISDNSGQKVSYVYQKEGVYNATLTVIDADNQQGSAVVVINVGGQPLQARLTANPIEGVVPLTVTFDASGSSYPNGQIVSYEWDFGDGSPKRIDVSQVTYKYIKIGTFNAKVTAIASDGGRSTAEIPVNVRPVSLNACFEATTEQGAAPLTVDFDPRCSSGTIAKYSWDFGDGENSKTRKPTHTFSKPGSYQVTLEVSDNQNVVDTYSKNILVTGSL